MSDYCIVSEFNPLHNGHAHIIKKAREMGADTVTCVMSGNATQRGELSIVNKYFRAEAAVRCGADLVVELPYPWCASGADYFGCAAVSVAKSFGNTLLFGSECGDIQILSRAASVCEGEEFKKQFEERQLMGEGAASAYVSCLAQSGFEKLCSNDLLGIAYIRAIMRMGAHINPVTVTRDGAAYNSEKILNCAFQSATALRECISRGEYNSIKEYIPDAMWQIIMREEQLGRLTQLDCIDALILGFFRLADIKVLEKFAECGGGIANRICDVAHSSTSAKDFFENLRTKRYTDAKLRRAVLFSMTGVMQEHISSLPEYTTLLAANHRGRELLAKNRKRGGITVVTKPADAPSDCAQYKLSQRLDSIYALARKNRLCDADFFRMGAYIEK